MIDFRTYPSDANSQILIVELTGRLDVESSDYLMECVQEELDSGAQSVVLDCQNLEYISSIGLGTIVRAALRVRKQKGFIALANVSGMVADVMNVAGLGKVFHLYPDVASAVAGIEEANDTK